MGPLTRVKATSQGVSKTVGFALNYACFIAEIAVPQTNPLNSSSLGE